jgi:hypothetical protein
MRIQPDPDPKHWVAGSAAASVLPLVPPQKERKPTNNLLPNFDLNLTWEDGGEEAGPLHNDTGHVQHQLRQVRQAARRAGLGQEPAYIDCYPHLCPPLLPY